MRIEAEFLVAGAGPAGATLARLLAAAGHDVVLLHRASSWPGRIEVLPPGAHPLLDALGLLPLLERPDTARRCLGIRRAWGEATIRHDDFLRHPGGVGHAVDRDRFDAALRDLAVRAGVRLIDGRLRVAARKESGLAAMIAPPAAGDALEVAARIGIDATGRVAALARRLGAIRRRATHRVARRIVAAQDGDGDAPGWLGVATAKHGWWYGIAGPGGRGEAWFVSTNGHADAGLPPPVVTQAAGHDAQRGDGRLAEAGMSCLDALCGPGWLAIGDAATAFDPIASQGLWQALATANSAADALATGAPDALGRHALRVAAGWRAALGGLPAVYAAERRFADAPFWRTACSVHPVAAS